MKRLQFVFLPHFHLHLPAMHKPCENRHGFTPLVCIVASPRRIETGGGKKSKEVEEKKGRKKKEKRRKERKHVSPLGRHGHPLKELRNLSRLECKPRRQVCLQRIYCDGSLLFHAGFTRYRRERMREMVRSLCKRNA